MANVLSDVKYGVDSDLLEGLSELTNYVLQNSGILNSHIIEAIPRPATNGDEVVLPNTKPSNCMIFFGRDRPRGISSGYGGRGHTHAGCIDIVAGLSGRLARSNSPKTNKKVKTNKSPELDAARIYISQKADVDDYFSLHDGKVGVSRSKSAIAIKADDVRIVAREGIKLVTGTDVFNSQSVRVTNISGIDLIAGNKGEELQPLVLGNNLIQAMKDQNEMIADLNGIVFCLVNSFLQLTTALASHVHVGAPLVGGPTSPSPDLAASCLTQLNNVALLLTDLNLHQSNIALHNNNFYTPIGEGFINSPYNNSN
mgnify:CR=1 FL=1|jgi:hypothetical protein